MTPKPDVCKEHTKICERIARIEGELVILIGLNVGAIGLIIATYFR